MERQYTYDVWGNYMCSDILMIAHCKCLCWLNVLCIYHSHSMYAFTCFLNLLSIFVRKTRIFCVNWRILPYLFTDKEMLCKEIQYYQFATVTSISMWSLKWFKNKGDGGQGQNCDDWHMDRQKLMKWHNSNH